jgi:hypothetical protein
MCQLWFAWVGMGWCGSKHQMVNQKVCVTEINSVQNNVSTTHDPPKGVLSMFPAIMVCQSNSMLGVLEKVPSHPFGKTPIIFSPLLWELKIH